MLQRGDDLVLTGQEARTREIDAGKGVVSDEGAINGQVFNEELQFLQHFLLCEGIELPALCFL